MNQQYTYRSPSFLYVGWMPYTLVYSNFLSLVTRQYIPTILQHIDKVH